MGSWNGSPCLVLAGLWITAARVVRLTDRVNSPVTLRHSRARSYCDSERTELQRALDAFVPEFR